MSPTPASSWPTRSQVSRLDLEFLGPSSDSSIPLGRDRRLAAQPAQQRASRRHQFADPSRQTQSPRLPVQDQDDHCHLPSQASSSNLKSTRSSEEPGHLLAVRYTVRIPDRGRPPTGDATDHVYKYLPAPAGIAVTAVQPDSASLPPWAGFCVFCLCTAVVLGLAARRMHRRDA